MSELTPSKQSAEATKLFEQIQLLTSANSTIDVLHALAQSLAMTVGFANGSKRQANTMLEKLLPDMKRTVRDNWDYLASLRAQATVDTVPRA